MPEATRRPLLVGLLTSVLAVAFENVAVATAMPRAAQDLGRIGLYAWAFTLFVLGMVLATVVAGRACDRRGPEAPFVVGQVLFLAGLVCAGQARSMLALVCGRFVQGLGGGAVNLSLMVVVALAFDERRRATVMSAFSFCWVLPAFVGPFVAGWITDRWSWHWVFRAVIPFVVVALLLVLPALRRLPRPDPATAPQAQVPMWAAGCAALGTAALQYAGQRMDTLGVLVAAVALAALALGVPRLMPEGFLRVGPGLAAVVWTRTAMAGSFFAAESFLPLMLVQQRHLSLTRAGMALTAGSLGWTLGSWLQSRPWLPMERHRVVIAGAMGQMLGVAMATCFALRPTLPLALVAVGWTLSGLGMGLGVAATSLAVMSLSDAATLGRNTSSLQVGEGLGNALLGGIAGSVFHLLDADGSRPAVFGAVFLVPLAASLLGATAARRVGRLPAAAATGGVEAVD